MKNIKEDLDKSRYLQATFKLPNGEEMLTACYIDDNDRIVISEQIMKKYITEMNRIKKERNEKDFDEILTLNREIMNQEMTTL